MFCMKCQYPLRGLSRCQCPECGQFFTPGDQRTYIVHEWQRKPQRERPAIRSPRIVKQRELDRRASAGTWPTILVFTAIGFVFMYGLFVLMFGAIEEPCWNWCYWVPAHSP